MASRRQVAALPLRRARNGALEIMLVTSRNTGRWIIPKGWTSRRLKDWKAAAREARHEAGVKGKIAPEAIGSYVYIKPELGEDTPIGVSVFLLNVRKQRKHWREERDRRRGWFELLEAASMVREPELSFLIVSLREPGHAPA
jgi:ADP-ribose pyrophosphatase YjhB (NUDIX family)